MRAATRSEFVASLEIVRDPRAPIVGATFHAPAPRRVHQSRRAPILARLAAAFTFAKA